LVIVDDRRETGSGDDAAATGMVTDVSGGIDVR
jgi:hypothetical protein